MATSHENRYVTGIPFATRLKQFQRISGKASISSSFPTRLSHDLYSPGILSTLSGSVGHILDTLLNLNGTLPLINPDPNRISSGPFGFVMGFIPSVITHYLAQTVQLLILLPLYLLELPFALFYDGAAVFRDLVTAIRELYGFPGNLHASHERLETGYETGFRFWKLPMYAAMYLYRFVSVYIVTLIYKAAELICDGITKFYRWVAGHKSTPLQRCVEAFSRMNFIESGISDDIDWSLLGSREQRLFDMISRGLADESAIDTHLIEDFTHMTRAKEFALYPNTSIQADLMTLYVCVPDEAKDLFVQTFEILQGHELINDKSMFDLLSAYNQFLKGDFTHETHVSLIQGFCHLVGYIDVAKLHIDEPTFRGICKQFEKRQFEDELRELKSLLEIAPVKQRHLACIIQSPSRTWFINKFLSLVSNSVALTPKMLDAFFLNVEEEASGEIGSGRSSIYKIQRFHFEYMSGRPRGAHLTQSILTQFYEQLFQFRHHIDEIIELEAFLVKDNVGGIRSMDTSFLRYVISQNNATYKTQFEFKPKNYWQFGRDMLMLYAVSRAQYPSFSCSNYKASYIAITSYKVYSGEHRDKVFDGIHTFPHALDAYAEAICRLNNTIKIDNLSQFKQAAPAIIDIIKQYPNDGVHIVWIAHNLAKSLLLCGAPTDGTDGINLNGDFIPILQGGTARGLRHNPHLFKSYVQAVRDLENNSLRQSVPNEIKPVLFDLIKQWPMQAGSVVKCARLLHANGLLCRLSKHGEGMLLLDATHHLLMGPNAQAVVLLCTTIVSGSRDCTDSFEKTMLEVLYPKFPLIADRLSALAREKQPLSAVAVSAWVLTRCFAPATNSGRINGDDAVHFIAAKFMESLPKSTHPMRTVSEMLVRLRKKHNNPLHKHRTLAYVDARINSMRDPINVVAEWPLIRYGEDVTTTCRDPFTHDVKPNVFATMVYQGYVNSYREMYDVMTVFSQAKRQRNTAYRASTVTRQLALLKGTDESSDNLTTTSNDHDDTSSVNPAPTFGNISHNSMLLIAGFIGAEGMPSEQDRRKICKANFSRLEEIHEDHKTDRRVQMPLFLGNMG